MLKPSQLLALLLSRQMDAKGSTNLAMVAMQQNGLVLGLEDETKDTFHSPNRDVLLLRASHVERDVADAVAAQERLVILRRWRLDECAAGR